MDTWILPAVRERQNTGELEKPLPIKMAQIIFKPEGGSPIVRVNDEIRGRAVVQLHDPLDKPLKAGDPLSAGQLKDVDAFELEEDERDYGHATLISLPDKWLITFDFIYNKQSSQEHIEAANEFVFAAQNSLNQNHLRAAIDSLHSASELAAKAYLLGSPDKTVINSKSHQVVHAKINRQRKLGNVDAIHIDTFNELSNLRSSARYLNSKLEIDAEQVQVMINDIKDFIANVNKRSEPKL